jgi:PadR family transcriptional regulator, regulatory protein AphA
MNTLSFGLLCILATHNYTGYELMLRIQPFWQAKHSQIYPLLAALEKDGLVLYEEVAQSDKPDKKIYSITEKGQNELKQWIAQPSAEPVTRDEMMLKAYCISIVDVDVIQTLFVEQEQMYKDRLTRYISYCDMIQKTDDGIVDIGFHSPQFGFYIILKKAIMNAEVNLEWCRWVKSQIKQK